MLPILLRAAQSGRFNGEVHEPGYVLASHIRKVTRENGEIEFKPRALIVSWRQRMHLNLTTPWGKGANPDHVFIITIDRFLGKLIRPTVMSEYEVNRHVKDLIFNKYGDRMEIEVEFERNTSQNIDSNIKHFKGHERYQDLAELEKVKESFLHDQRVIKTTIENALKKYGIKTMPVSESKYSSLPI